MFRQSIKRVILFGLILSISVLNAQIAQMPSAPTYKLPKSEYIKKESGKIKFYPIPPLSKETLQIITAGSAGVGALSALGIYNIVVSEMSDLDEILLPFLFLTGGFGLVFAILGGIGISNFDSFKKPILELDDKRLKCRDISIVWTDIDSVKMKRRQVISGYGDQQSAYMINCIAIRLKNGVLHDITLPTIAISLIQVLEVINIFREVARQHVEKASA